MKGKMDTRSLDATRLLAHVLAGSGRHREARDLLLGILAADPGDAAARRSLVAARLALGEYDEAEPDARRVADTEEGAGRAPALFLHAHALWGCGRLDECRAAVDRYAASLAAENSE